MASYPVPPEDSAHYADAPPPPKPSAYNRGPLYNHTNTTTPICEAEGQITLLIVERRLGSLWRVGVG
ncbi:unnamed protein product [Merluccius merluccius]